MKFISLLRHERKGSDIIIRIKVVAALCDFLSDSNVNDEKFLG